MSGAVTFHRVTDAPMSLHQADPLLFCTSLTIPVGRYALLASDNAVRRPVLDLITGTRPPFGGHITRKGLPSWAIGRSAFMRGRSTGEELIRLIARLYHLDRRLSEGMAADMMSQPERLEEPIDSWDSTSRTEFGHILALLPSFDIYVFDGTLPYRKSSFTKIWNILIRERIENKTLIMSTARPAEALEFCDRALIIENGQIRISEQLEQALVDYPPRTVIDAADGSGRASEPILIDNSDFI